ncbi:transcriptional regulator [Vibrio parahaemolyticus]|nr:transcriptional regulator [Vibrio parahaemolyticus]
MKSFEDLQLAYPNLADRLAFIDFKLRYTGIIKRSEIGEMFNVGAAAASKVISKYVELCPENIEYDPRTRLNTIVRSTFKPLLDIDAETALGMLANGFNKNKLYTTPKTILAFEKIGKIPNQLDTNCIAKIARAIDGKYAIKCTYLSENSDNRSTRTILPLTIMYDGVNWMFRGYDRDCDKKTYFKSFHFSRCRDTEECYGVKTLEQKPHESLEQDKSWMTQVPLELELHPNLDEKEKSKVRTNFGMGDNEERTIIPTRQTFIWILTKKWFIDTRPLEQIERENNVANETGCRKRYYNFRLTNLETIRYYQKLIEDSKN